MSKGWIVFFVISIILMAFFYEQRFANPARLDSYCHKKDLNSTFYHSFEYSGKTRCINNTITEYVECNPFGCKTYKVEKT